MKKAFTLIELIAVIILLGLLGLIIYPTVNGVINTNKQKLHNKQIEELKRHASTYATYNIGKMKKRYGSKNIVTFTDLYEAGIIQNDKVVDPSTEKDLTGCMSLTWNPSRNQFDIDYTEDCNKTANLTGTITENNNPISLNVYLLQDEEIIYTTTTDSSGNYQFNNIDTGRYILLASTPYKTRYGREVEINDNTTKDMNAIFYVGDFSNDGVVNKLDHEEINRCYHYVTNHTPYPGCLDWKIYDVVEDDDNTITSADVNKVATSRKITDIKFIDTKTHRVSGKLSTTARRAPKTISIASNDNRYTVDVDEDGSFEFTNIPSGSYYIEVTYSRCTTYYKFFIINDDITNLKVNIYFGDVSGDGRINQTDVNWVRDAIAAMEDGDEYDYNSDSDLNVDRVIDKKDLEFILDALEKYNKYMKEEY